jgi:hypothetical protein
MNVMETIRQPWDWEGYRLFLFLEWDRLARANKEMICKKKV